MSVMRKNGCKIVLPRTGREELWQAIRRHYADANQLKWKHLAMLWLRTQSDWPLEQIGLAFGLSRGHVVRSLRSIRKELRDHLLATPEMLAGLGDGNSCEQASERNAEEPESP